MDCVVYDNSQESLRLQESLRSQESHRLQKSHRSQESLRLQKSHRLQESLRLQKSLHMQLENAENQIGHLLQINGELTARCEFLQQNFNGNYNELLIEYQTLNRVFQMNEKNYQEMLKKYK